MTTRANIVAKAREFIGTPFRHQGRVKGVGLDCVGLILCVAEELGLRDKNGTPLLAADYSNYNDQPQGRFVHDRCGERLTVKPLHEILPGDVVTLRIPTDPCHTAIIGEIPGQGLSIIHCYSGGQERCVEHRLDERWERRIVGVFQFSGIEA